AAGVLGKSGGGRGTVNLDQTPAVVSITSPADGTISSSANVSVQGLTSDGLSGIASVSCNGTAATVSGGSFSCTVQITQGALSVSVQATDVAGNTATATIGVSLQG